MVDLAAKHKVPKTIRNSDGTRMIAAGQFKAKCLQLLDEVARTREILIVTKFGRPVAQVAPLSVRHDLFGALKGSVLWEGDIISPLDDEWEANQ